MLSPGHAQNGGEGNECVLPLVGMLMFKPHGVVKGEKGGEGVPVFLTEDGYHVFNHPAAVFSQQIKQQLPLILKIHIEAAPGNARVPDNAVDGNLGKGHAGKFRPGRL
ncbi:hypothetical protein SDC9_115492 [bioreactor metagenome]|uniref:Uncharacterized protein n=1 Tax=bioreactor metagenome TaxID=1076179 RepID=A0A645BT11_9ZZZZ